jgi:cob(I)alamin adenosyltransferase
MVSQLETPTLNSTHPLTYTLEGLVQVFTSPQRSFFTNVIAQGLRIAGQGTPVLVVQFLKGGIGQGHQHPIRLGQYLVISLSRGLVTKPLLRVLPEDCTMFTVFCRKVQ